MYYVFLINKVWTELNWTKNRKHINLILTWDTCIAIIITIPPCKFTRSACIRCIASKLTIMARRTDIAVWLVNRSFIDRAAVAEKASSTRSFCSTESIFRTEVSGSTGYWYVRSSWTECSSLAHSTWKPSQSIWSLPPGMPAFLTTTAKHVLSLVFYL